MGFFSKLFGKKEESGSHMPVVGKLAFLEVDMHNHILPGIDDGSTSVEQSIRLIKGIQRMGISSFIATPHILDGLYNNTFETIHKAKSQLDKGLREENMQVDIYPAAEHMIDEGLNTIVKNNQLCVMPSGHVLIEMSYLQESISLFQTIYDIQMLGYKPILAHPERYNYYHYNFDMYKKIKDTGCLLQLNLLSVSRYYGMEVKSAALNLIKSGMYDFVGTDMHHDKHLRAIQEVVTKYPIRDMLKTCDIKNPTLLDDINNQTNSFVG